MKINWKQKLSSRKFWAAAAGFVTALLAAVGVPDLTTQRVIAIITAGSALVAYILSEGYIDGKRIEIEAKKEDET